MKIYNKPRRSGKTEELIEQVQWVSIFSQEEEPNIWIVIPSTAMKVLIERRIKELNITGVNINYCTYMGSTIHTRPNYIFVDEYTHCNKSLIEHIENVYPDRTVMWGTPNE